MQFARRQEPRCRRRGALPGRRRRAPFSGGPALRASARRELMSRDQSVRRGSSPPLCLGKKDQRCLLDGLANSMLHKQEVTS